MDLTPFGFTPTESLVYHALLRLGSATGYAVARGAGLARANTYSALDGLVTRGAATRVSGRPVRYRPTEPAALVAQLAARQGEALDRLSHALRDATAVGEPSTQFVTGARAIANLVLRLVARAERHVSGVLAAELFRPTLPAWRRAAAQLALELRLAGDTPAPPADSAALIAGTVRPGSPTIVLVDEAATICALAAGGEPGEGAGGEALVGLWSSHPVIVALARTALAAIE